MPAPDFLKKLQESLEKGEKIDEVTDHLNKIDELASRLTGQQAAEKLDKRIIEVGEKDRLSEEKRREIDEALNILDLEQKENDKKLLLIANIQGKEKDIEIAELEYKQLIDEFILKISNLNFEKLKLMEEYEKNYGENLNNV